MVSVYCKVWFLFHWSFLQKIVDLPHILNFLCSKSILTGCTLVPTVAVVLADEEVVIVDVDVATVDVATVDAGVTTIVEVWVVAEGLTADKSCDNRPLKSNFTQLNQTKVDLVVLQRLPSLRERAQRVRMGNNRGRLLRSTDQKMLELCLVQNRWQFVMVEEIDHRMLEKLDYFIVLTLQTTSSQ